MPVRIQRIGIVLVKMTVTVDIVILSIHYEIAIEITGGALRERINDLDSGVFEIVLIAGGDSQLMNEGGCRDQAVCLRHVAGQCSCCRIHRCDRP